MSGAIVLADAQAARRDAAAILRDGRFHNPSVPRPLHSVLHDFGSWLRGLGDAITSAVAAVGTALPGGTVTAWILLGALLCAVVVLVSRRYTRRALAGHPATAPLARRRQDAAALERAADAAEREGRFAEAVRLRFRAGLERLSEQGVIAPARALPTAEVSRRLASDQFEALARRFDEIAYGSAPAAASDAQSARDGWTDVVAGARRR